MLGLANGVQGHINIVMPYVHNTLVYSHDSTCLTRFMIIIDTHNK